MVEQIEQLLNASASGAEAPTLAHMEATLTDGYAQALALEAERWRLERRLGEVARTVDGPDVASFAEEISALAKRLASAEGELTELRTLLGTLRERTRSVRVAARTA
jgi:hypothetical protein